MLYMEVFQWYLEDDASSVLTQNFKYFVQTLWIPCILEKQVIKVNVYFSPGLKILYATTLLLFN